MGSQLLAAILMGSMRGTTMDTGRMLRDDMTADRPARWPGRSASGGLEARLAEWEEALR